MLLKIMPSAPNIVVIISRKTADTKSQSTVHIFVPAILRAATDTLIAAASHQHKTSIFQSMEINEGKLHAEIHAAADGALEARGATAKYSEETHCHITNLNDGGAGFIASVLHQYNVLTLDEATDLLYKMTAPKLNKDDPTRASFEEKESLKGGIKKAMKNAMKKPDAFVNPGFFSEYFANR